MKNKKSKIIVPALGLILLSTAASISGSVAWFTANRTATVKAGDFAVVKTSDDLDVVLGTGVGTSKNDANKTISNVTNDGLSDHTNKLSDASFDHTALYDTNAHGGIIVQPNAEGKLVGANTELNGVVANDLKRATDVYSALTWTMTFTLTFSDANADQGLFLDLGDAATYMHEKISFAQSETIPAGTYWTTAECEGEGTTYNSDTPADAAKTLYQRTADASGKAFRIAFFPTAIGGTGDNTSIAYAKVWGGNEDTAANKKFVDGVNEGVALSGTSYDTDTVKLTGNHTSATYASESAGSGKVFMGSGDTTRVPEDNEVSASTALSTKSNFLGLFKADPGKTVSITYTCVAWYEGCSDQITSGQTDFEIITASMRFGVATLA